MDIEFAFIGSMPPLQYTKRNEPPYYVVVQSTSFDISLGARFVAEAFCFLG